MTRFLLEQGREEDQRLATRLLQYLGSAASVQTILRAIDTTGDPVEARAALELLDHLGVHALHALLEHVGDLEQVTARRRVVEVVARYASQDPDAVVRHMRDAPAPAVRDLMGLGEKLDPAVAAGLVWLGLEHADPGVRSRAVALLRGFSGGQVEARVAEAIGDPEPQVRGAALRAAAQRRSQPVLDALVGFVRGADLSAVEPGELRQALGALVAVGGNKSTPLLGRLLNESGALGLRRSHTDVQVAAAHALGQLGTPEARRALSAGTRTLNRKVKQACKKAMEAQPTASLHLDLPSRFGSLPPRPAALDESLAGVKEPAALEPYGALPVATLSPPVMQARLHTPAPVSGHAPPIAPPSDRIAPEAPAVAPPEAAPPPPLLDPSLLSLATPLPDAPEAPAEALEPAPPSFDAAPFAPPGPAPSAFPAPWSRIPPPRPPSRSTPPPWPSAPPPRRPVDLVSDLAADLAPPPGRAPPGRVALAPDDEEPPS